MKFVSSIPTPSLLFRKQSVSSLLHFDFWNFAVDWSYFSEKVYVAGYDFGLPAFFVYKNFEALEIVFVVVS